MVRFLPVDFANLERSWASLLIISAKGQAVQVFPGSQLGYGACQKTYWQVHPWFKLLVVLFWGDCLAPHAEVYEVSSGHAADQEVGEGPAEASEGPGERRAQLLSSIADPCPEARGVLFRGHCKVMHLGHEAIRLGLWVLHRISDWKNQRCNCAAIRDPFSGPIMGPMILRTPHSAPKPRIPMGIGWFLLLLVMHALLDGFDEPPPNF